MFLYEIIYLFVGLAYMGVLAWLFSGWYVKIPGSSRAYDGVISVIVAARNEEHHIQNLLHDLADQQDNRFEVIIVDDHSDDGTFEIVNQFGRAFSLIKNNGIGKKEALQTGISKASGDYILITDADCRVNADWVSEWRLAISSGKKLLFGPIKYESRDGIMYAAIRLEFILLAALGGSALNRRQALMANAANMCIHKASFYKVGAFKAVKNYPGGDDIFLVSAFYEHGLSHEVGYYVKNGLQVETSPAASAQEFYHQRIRWAGKWNKSKKMLLWYPIVIVGWNLLLVTTPLFYYSKVVHLSLMASVLLELFIFLQILSFYKEKYLLWLYPIVKIFYPVYSIFFAVAVNFGSFSWKKRAYKI